MTAVGATATRTRPAATPPPVRRRRRSRGALVAMILGYLVLTLFAFVYLFPFVVQIATSFKTNADATQNSLDLIPDPFTVDAYRRLFQADFPLWFWNSVVVTLLVTAGRVFFNALAGYALARLPFAGRTFLFASILAVIAVPPIILLIPKFLVLREIGIWNTYPALVVPLMADAAGIFIMKQFFESIPVSVEEAARIDGAGTFRTFWSVVLPMARPALLTITILAFQGSWNEFPHFLIASQDPELYTLTKGVATLTTGGLGSGNQYPITLAAGIIMTIPVAIIFFVFQRYFVRGATAGAEKG
jgi:multiple sugar transport system permease protein